MDRSTGTSSSTCHMAQDNRCNLSIDGKAIIGQLTCCGTYRLDRAIHSGWRACSQLLALTKPWTAAFQREQAIDPVLRIAQMDDAIDLSASLFLGTDRAADPFHEQQLDERRSSVASLALSDT